MEQHNFEKLCCQAGSAPFLFPKQDSNIWLVQSTWILRASSHKIHWTHYKSFPSSRWAFFNMGGCASLARYLLFLLLLSTFLCTRFLPVPILSRGFWRRSLAMRSWASGGSASSPSGQAISSGDKKRLDIFLPASRPIWITIHIPIPWNAVFSTAPES